MLIQHAGLADDERATDAPTEELYQSFITQLRVCLDSEAATINDLQRDELLFYLLRELYEQARLRETAHNLPDRAA